MKESVKDLRQSLQEPRKAFDTWYGWYVMRRFSIYFTMLALRNKWTPGRVTVLSLIAGLTGGIFFTMGWIGMGLLCFNLWYMLDHSDGEVARYLKQTSASGYFFDTILNFIIQPVFFVSLGWGLSREGSSGMAVMGTLAAFGSLLLMILPLCEDAIILSVVRKKGYRPTCRSESTQPNDTNPDLPRRLFMVGHQLVTYPSVLLTTTVLYLVPLILRWPVNGVFSFYLSVYALSIHAIWIAQLFIKIASRKTDEHPMIQSDPEPQPQEHLEAVENGR